MDAEAIAGLISTLVNAVDRFGIAAVFSVFLGVVLLWIRPYLDRGFKAHIELVETLKSEAPKQTAAMETMSDAVASMQGEKAALHHITKGIEEIPDCEERRKAVRVHTQNARDALNRTQN